jgi:iron complex outermembrane receptor protein
MPLESYLEEFMLPSLFGALLALSTASGPVPVPADSLPGARVSGTVTSTDGTPLVAARVTVIEAGRTVETDAEGKYLFANLPNGSYTFSYSAIGYAPHARRVQLNDAPLSMDIALKRSLVELAPIQVTSTPNATDPLTSPQPTAVIDGENLHAAQAPSLGETLNTVAGVHSLSTGAGIGKPVIRGLTSNRVLILDDGQRMETQQWGDEHGPNIETANADRIEVIR